jgi:hypothetical protein
MFKFVTIPQQELARIRQMKKGSEYTKRLELLGGAGPAKFTFPHKTFTIYLNDLLDKHFVPVSTGVRVIEANNNSFYSIYDLNETNEGTEPQMFMDKNFLQDYETAFSSILGTKLEEEGYEVRTLNVPALNIDALWLHNQQNRKEDKFLPVRTIEESLQKKMYNAQDFYAALQELAQQFDTGENDTDEMKGMLGG